MPVLKIPQVQCLHRFHRDLPPTKVWAYAASLPGPTLEVRQHQGLEVDWSNQLPAVPLFPVANPQVMHGVCGDLPPVRTVVHLHGASVTGEHFADPSRNDDGYPDAWNRPGGVQRAVYPNDQPATCLWYHDHAVGITARNTYAGLAGFYLIRDAYEDRLHLPQGAYEIPLMIQARSFHADGSLDYPSKASSDEVYGDMTVVNGKIWPYLDVQARLYRFRVLNASGARSYALQLLGSDGKAGPAFHQIGSDGGFLPAPVTLNDPADEKSPRLTLAPAERADILIDFSAYAGQTLTLNNNSQTDETANEPAVPDVLRIRVAATAGPAPKGEIPASLRPIARYDPATVRRTRRIFFSEPDLPGEGQMMLLNGLHWEDPIVEKPVLGSLELWELVNETSLMHPFHMHLVQFQVLDRQSIDLFLYEKLGQVVPTWKAVPPLPGEAGWKDTVQVPPGMVTRILIRFGPFTGRFVYHCHILEHEDMDMMRPFEVVAAPPAADARSEAVAPKTDPNLDRPPGPLVLEAHYRQAMLKEAEDRLGGFEIVPAAPGHVGRLRFFGAGGALLRGQKLAYQVHGSRRIRETAVRSRGFAVVTRLQEEVLGPGRVRTLAAETAIYDRAGRRRFSFAGRGRVEASPSASYFIWLPESGDGVDFKVQGPVFLDGRGQVLDDQRDAGQVIGSLAAQVAFSPKGRYAAVAFSAPQLALSFFKDAQPLYQLHFSHPNDFSKAFPFDNGDLACLGFSQLVFYRQGRELARSQVPAESCLAAGDQLFCVTQFDPEDNEQERAIDLVRFDSDGSGQDTVQGLHGMNGLDAGQEAEIQILQPGGEIFVYKLSPAAPSAPVAGRQ